MTANSDRQMISSWIWRGVGYFALWVLLIGFKPADLVVGLAAAAAATWNFRRSRRCGFAYSFGSINLSSTKPRLCFVSTIWPKKPARG